MPKNTCAVVLGGYVNGYTIIRELWECGIRTIILIDTKKDIASFSRKIVKFLKIRDTREDLLGALEALHAEYASLVIYPTNDPQLEQLTAMYDRIREFCFLPFNPRTIPFYLGKLNQHALCRKTGVPVPATTPIHSTDDLDRIAALDYPVLIKPNLHYDLRSFKNIAVWNGSDLSRHRKTIEQFLAAGRTFLASEIIPGAGSSVYAYVAYRDRGGTIRNEWSGKKLGQYPDDFGVFSSATNVAPPEVEDQGRRLLEASEITGIAEPEFKFDHRDGRYKLTEINLRPMMWHRVGHLAGVHLMYSVYCDAVGKEVHRDRQIRDRKIHLVYFKHEALNLLHRRGYLGTYLNNLMRSDETHYATFDLSDPLPWLVDSFALSRAIPGAILRRRVPVSPFP